VTMMPDPKNISQLSCPRSCQDLFQAISGSAACAPNRSFERLHEAIDLTRGFMKDTLPFVWHEALQAPRVLPNIPMLESAGAVHLTQRQCLCLLANAFLCTFTDRPSDNCLSGPGLPSINCDELYGGHGWGSVEVAKLRMLLAYFQQMCERHSAGDDLSHTIAFTRRKATNSSAADWQRCETPLLAPRMHGLGESLDDAKEMFRVDFANRIIGGAAIAHGCVQEEIMFCECPEMIASRLFCPIMQADEAIVIVGAEQFSQHSGYAGSLRFEGRYRDRSPVSDGMLDSHVVAIDAIDLRSGNTNQQYSGVMVLRELTKTWAGFDVAGSPPELATGNWGCGVFGGDPELKSIIQWLACSRAGKTMNYFPFDNERVFRQLPNVAEKLIASRLTVGRLAGFLLEELQPGNLFGQLKARFE
jgi:poly(ADP-ribose) glycohydrolase